MLPSVLEIRHLGCAGEDTEKPHCQYPNRTRSQLFFFLLTPALPQLSKNNVQSSKAQKHRYQHLVNLQHSKISVYLQNRIKIHNNNLFLHRYGATFEARMCTAKLTAHQHSFEHLGYQCSKQALLKKLRTVFCTCYRK